MHKEVFYCEFGSTSKVKAILKGLVSKYVFENFQPAREREVLLIPA